MSFQPAGPWVWLVAAILILIPLLLQKPGRNLTLRRALALTAGLALALLGLRPSLPVAVADQSIVLITPGAETLDKADESLPKIALEENHIQAEQTLVDLYALRRTFPDLKVVHIFGHGPDPRQWPALDGVTIQAHHQTDLPRPNHIDRPHQLYLGEPFILNLRLDRDLKESDRLIIQTPDGADHQPAQTNTIYQFTNTPRALGQFTYTLTLSRDEATVWTMPLTVQVRQPQPLAILFLEDAPSFETRAVKNWLAQRAETSPEGAHAYLVRARITEDRYRFEQHNRQPFDALTTAVLSDYHLLVADPRALNRLTNPERTALQTAITNQGLGLLIRHNPDIDNADQNAFTIQTLPDIQQRSVIPVFPGEPTTNAALIAPPRHLASNPSQRIIATDRAGRILIAAKPVGKGHIALNLLDQTHRWPLRGDTEQHRRFWSHLIQTLAAPIQTPTTTWRTASGLPPNTAEPLYLTHNQANKGTRQNPHRPGLFGEIQHPSNPGFQNGIHIAAQVDIAPIKEAKRLQALQARATQPDQQQPAMIEHQKPIPPIIWWTLFLITTTALWLERKLAAR